MTRHPAELAAIIESLRSRAAAACDDERTAQRSRDLTPEAKTRRARALRAPVGRDAHALLPELQQAVRAVRQQRASLAPSRSTDRADISHAERTLNMLHQLTDAQFQQAIHMPEIRRIAGTYATAIDEMLIAPRLPGDLLGGLKTWRQEALLADAKQARVAKQIDDHEQTLLAAARDAGNLAAAAMASGFEDMLGDRAGLTGQAGEIGRAWARSVEQDRDLETDASFTVTRDTLAQLGEEPTG